MRDNGRIVFKGDRNGLYIKMAQGVRFDVLMRELERKLAASGGFFRGAEAVVDVGDRVLTTEQLLTLESLLEQKGGFELAEVLHEPRSTARTCVGDDGARLVRRTLHSGQSIHHDGNLVVLGDVNPGAEVVAAGDVVVVGTLRGLVHAGAVGDTDAVIIAFNFCPIQLRIADVISRSPAEAQAGRPQQPVPEIARLQGGVIVVEEYLSNADCQPAPFSGRS